MQSDRLELQVPAEELAIWRSRAERAALPLSDFIRQAMRDFDPNDGWPVMEREWANMKRAHPELVELLHEFNAGPKSAPAPRGD